MRAKIDTYQLADGTLAGGRSLSGLRIQFNRIHEIIMPIGGPIPVLFPRGVTRSTIDFNVTRVHASIAAAEQFILEHNDSLPPLGLVSLMSSGPFISTATVLNGKLFSQLLNTEIGATTIHAYHIEGGTFDVTVTPGTPGYITTEDGSILTTEDGTKITTE